VESLALYNGQRTLLLEVQKSQGENTIEVVDGLLKALQDMKAQLPPACGWRWCRDNSRPIRVSVENVRAPDRRRAAHRADRVPVPALLALDGDHRPHAADRADRHLPVHVRLRLHDQHDHADGAVAVRRPADRRRDRGAREHRAPRADGQDAPPRRAGRHQEIGLAVLATTFSIVAVFLPIGFMGGIIGKFFFEFGVTIVAAVLISMFVSFTLDPMLSSVWHDPEADASPKPASTSTRRSAPRSS
jgi:HAE1 family hydrophobic/amphiphilic exporter-1